MRQMCESGCGLSPGYPRGPERPVSSPVRLPTAEGAEGALWLVVWENPDVLHTARRSPEGAPTSAQ
jgi:hypothetical protein